MYTSTGTISPVPRVVDGRLTAPMPNPSLSVASCGLPLRRGLLALSIQLVGKGRRSFGLNSSYLQA